MMATQSFNESGISIDLVDFDVDDPAISYPIKKIDSHYKTNLRWTMILSYAQNQPE